MKNVTISMDEELYRVMRIEAAKAGISLSKYMALAAQEKLQRPAAIDDTRRKRQFDAIQSILAGPKWNVTIDGRMPTSDERNARR